MVEKYEQDKTEVTVVMQFFKNKVYTYYRL